MAANAFGSPVNQTQTTTQGIASYAQPAVNQIIGRATELAQRPYESYGGERVAGLSGLQNQALGGIGGLQPAGAFQYSPTQQFTSGIAQQYMNPFTDVLQQREQQRAGQAAAQEGANAVAAGAFGGYRQGVQKAIGADLSAMRSMDIDRQAFENAQRQFNQYQTQDFQRQQAQDRANQLAQQGAMDVYGAQLRAGATPRDIEQQRNEANYQDWLSGKEYDWKNVGRLQSALSGLPITNTTQTINYGKGSPLGQALGLGVAGSALYKMAGGADGIGKMFGGIGGLRPGLASWDPNQYSQSPSGSMNLNPGYRSEYDNPGADMYGGIAAAPSYSYNSSFSAEPSSNYWDFE
jgi:hypothetical protein